ncbi:hypothetical protein AWR27_02740 [Spirosoma montaniterrae]|uniref:Murein L,D-transpeptidase catalytic domain family protein n=2 Tax=Spirosoma montaniterrae TaxID=1178516 RepID=A0A1P9WSK8_9BACT|nr:hypothetical protein AWR27_02740 [Spirosoma montaniterrae]
MRNVLLPLAGLVLIYLAATTSKPTPSDAKGSPVAIHVTAPVAPKATGHLAVYDQLNLEQMGLHRDVFEYALRGWQKMDTEKPVLSIVDMSQPSTKKRFYVVDLQNKKLLFNTYVAHGQNSGDLIPKRFSNVNASFQTSLGFYRTLGTYMGKHGLSLQLKGLEKGVNDQVQNRNIVLHGADYACEEWIKKNGRLGRSQGCPAVPYTDSKGIIEAVKGGTCLFVYAPNTDYISQSAYLASPYTSL